MWSGDNSCLSKDTPLNYMYKNTVYLLDEISDRSCAFLIGDLYEYVMNRQNFGNVLNFVINSPGGDVYVMMTLIGLINIAKINGITVNTFVMGVAASAASVIAVQGDNRKISKVSRHFVHFGTMWNATERYSEIEKIYEQTRDYAERIDNLYLEACPGLTKEKLRTLQLDERGYLTAEQCVEYGLCDDIIENDLAEANHIETKANEFESLFESYKDGDYDKMIKHLEKLKSKKNGTTKTKTKKDGKR